LLHGMRLEARADLFHPRRARRAVVARRFHLDELMRLERALDLGEHFAGQPLVADDRGRGERMRLGAQLAAA
jgi:hypothetical protein